MHSQSIPHECSVYQWHLSKTIKNRRLTLNLALNYGSQEEILTACKKVAKNIEIFGPVSSPYAVASVITDRPKHYVGSTLYKLGDQNNDKKRKNKWFII